MRSTRRRTSPRRPRSRRSSDRSGTRGRPRPRGRAECRRRRGAVAWGGRTGSSRPRRARARTRTGCGLSRLRVRRHAHLGPRGALAALAAEVDRFAVAHDRWRAHRRDRHPADRIHRDRRSLGAPRPQTSPGAPRRLGRGRRSRSRRRCEPIGMPAGTSIRWSWSSSTPAARSSSITAAPRRGLRRVRRRAGPPERAAQRVQLVAPVGGDDERQVAGRRLWIAAVGPHHLESELGPIRAGADGRRVADEKHPGLGGDGSRKTSIAPPDRQVLHRDRALLPVGTSSPASSGVSSRRHAGSGGSAEHRLFALQRQQGVGLDAVLGTSPTDEALDRAVGEHERDVLPGSTLAGCWTRTTVAVTKRLAGLRRAPALVVHGSGRSLRRLGASLHRRPHARRRARHVDVVDPVCLVQRVDHRVDDRRRRADVGRLADALGAERVVRARRDRLAELEVGGTRARSGSGSP